MMSNKEKNKQWVVYILECKDGTYYTGITNDIERRIEAHACGRGSKYVWRKGFSHLIATKDCIDRSDAMKAERYVKSLHRNQKIEWFSN